MEDDSCPICHCFPETSIHALWECGTAQDVWAGCPIRILQKGLTNQFSVMRLFENVMHKLTDEDFEFFLIQVWLISNQRILVLQGGILQEPGRLNARAGNLLREFQEAQTQLTLPVSNGRSQTWKPPEGQVYKLNFEAAIFADLPASSIVVIIRNDSGQVMVALSSKGSAVQDSEEAEVLACRKALEFAVDAGSSDLIVEGDNTTVMNSIALARSDLSRLGNIYNNIRCLVGGLQLVEFNSISRSANGVTHSLTRYAKHLGEDIVWLEDSPPPALEALYLDSMSN